MFWGDDAHVAVVVAVLGILKAGAEIILKLLKRIDELEIKLNNTQETLTNLQNRVIRKPSVNNQKEA